MKITKTQNGNSLYLALEGRLDTNTAPELEASIKGSVDGVEELTIDMEALDYLSSAGLRVLLGAQKIMNKQGSMRVTHVNDTIMDIFEVTGFADILTIEKA
ncbi:putative anti-sigma factor antagonist BtrV [Lachnospiraceae bacterium]|jgi:anti-sigma B factor antagonist|nr:STAS domain-containing protein [Lachnospiraceae bacterium]GFI68898.1 putative anti-sigma factor antagonist BtrV [Lachnospiraceae bacterium]